MEIKIVYVKGLVDVKDSLSFGTF